MKIFILEIGLEFDFNVYIPNVSKKNKSLTRRLRINNKKIFLDWLYKNSTIYLERKYQIYKESYNDTKQCI
jgi:hypothetical protein